MKMKAFLETARIQTALAVALIGFSCAIPVESSARDKSATVNELVAQDKLPTTRAVAVATSDQSTAGDEVSIEAVETADKETVASPKELPWLGISTTEAPEALAAQLDLQPGVGLVVTYLTPDGPAAKAGLKKNDVLIQFEDQSLVHPAQLRKLVRVRKEGDSVTIAFYRSGKRQMVSVTLGKTVVDSVPLDADGELPQHLRTLERKLKDLRLDDTVRAQMDSARESLDKMKMDLKLDQRKIKEEIQRSMTQTRSAIEQALRSVTNSNAALAIVRKSLENLQGPGLVIGNNAAVTVRSSGKGVKSLVNTDDSGTIVLVNKPKLHLTAHDKDGNLLFDGEIESADQRAKVPAEVWERVEPLLKKMGGNTTEELEPEDKQ